MTDEIRFYEELSMNSFPALQTELYDGWVLRFARGNSNRANSVSMLYPSALDVTEKIAECEQRYARRGLPVVFKLTGEPESEKMDELLEKRGYGVLHPTYLMVADLRDKVFTMDDRVKTASSPDDNWFRTYFAFGNYTDDKKKAAAVKMHGNVLFPAVYGLLYENKKAVACGSAVVERGHAALLNIIVEDNERGKGFGRAICESLLAAAKNMGAFAGYLQVVQDNARAINLYKSLGYEVVYSYWYRTKTVI